MSDVFDRAGDAEVEIDWAERDLRRGETLRESLGWSVTPGHDGLVVVGEALSIRRSRAKLRGGVPGHVYHVAHRVRTSDLRVLVRSRLLRVA